MHTAQNSVTHISAQVKPRNQVRFYIRYYSGIAEHTNLLRCYALWTGWLLTADTARHRTRLIVKSLWQIYIIIRNRMLVYTNNSRVKRTAVWNVFGYVQVTEGFVIRAFHRSHTQTSGEWYGKCTMVLWVIITFIYSTLSYYCIVYYPYEQMHNTHTYSDTSANEWPC